MSTGNASEAVLTSLPLLDALRTDPKTADEWIRQAGSNLDVLPSNPASNRNIPIAICHLDAFLPFTEGDKRAVQLKYEDATAVALAAHHLNVGDGTIVPQVEGLNERCNIRFTLEYADTEYTASVALEHVVEATERQPGSERMPCAFIGAYRSSISMPTSILTGLQNYPQISASSTSAALDDKNQYPLFGRTIPSDHGNAIPIIQFMNRVLRINHLAVLNVNDAYGNSFVQGLRLAADIYAPDMQIHQSPVDEGQASIRSALEAIKQTRYRYIFAIVFTQETHDFILTEAYNMGLAGTGEHQWLFGDSFSKVTGRNFDEGSPLHLAYRGVGMLEATGGVPGVGLTGYEKLRDLMASLNNPDDLDYLFSLFPQHEEPAFEESLRNFENFLTPANGAQVPFMYEAAIALGLAACSVSPGVGEDENFFLDGREHYDTLVNSVFEGVNGDVVFDPETGSKDPSYTLYKVTNFVDHKTADDTTVRFEEVFTHIYEEGEWNELNAFVFNDGSTLIPSDIPPVDISDEVLSLTMRIVVLTLCGIICCLVFGFMGWTHKHRKARVVLASQPFFLHTINIGVLVMGTTIIPLSIDHGLVSIQGCSIACTCVPWLTAMGFSTTVSALFTKTHRINIILNNANRMQRIKVTIWDVAKPMLFLLSMNTIILSVMSALAPATYQIIVESRDDFGRPDVIRGQCQFQDPLPYIASVCLMNFGALVLTIAQAIKARNLSTEFAESAQIFRILISIILVLFVGGPVLVLARENVNTFVFVASAIIFVTSASIVLLLFVPKMYFLKLAKRKLPNRVHISGIEMSRETNSRVSLTTDSSCGDTEEFTGMRILTTKTPQELVQELDELKRLLKKERAAREIELGDVQDAAQGVARPRPKEGRSKSILKNSQDAELSRSDRLSISSRSEISSISENMAKVQEFLKSDRSSTGTLESVHEVSSLVERVQEGEPNESSERRLISLREKRAAAKKKFDNLKFDSNL